MDANSKGPTDDTERDQPETFRARSVSPSLTVKDVEKSLTWYRDVAGFTVAQRHVRDGTLRAVSMKAGAVQFLLGQDDGKKGWERVKGQGISLMFRTTQNVDEIAERIKANGGTLDAEPADTPWGTRVFRLRDPDGFVLVISSEG